MALQGSLWIPYVAVPAIRMTGRLAIIKRRRNARSCEADGDNQVWSETRTKARKTPEMAASPGLLRL